MTSILKAVRPEKQMVTGRGSVAIVTVVRKKAVKSEMVKYGLQAHKSPKRLLCLSYNET